jgi:predicted Zn-dependent peptidase
LEAPIDFSQRSLANGAELIVIPDPVADQVTLNILFRGGTSADPPRLAGLASLTAQILTHSTRNRTREELAGDLNRIGAEIGAAAGPDYTTVSLVTDRDRFGEAVALMADVVLSPVLPADQLAGRAARARQMIGLQEASPEFQASRTFIRTVYANHPYGLVETSETLARIDVQNAVRYHRDFYRPNNAVFVASGDVTADAVALILEEAFSDWPEQPLSLPTYYGLPEDPGGRITLVHIPGAPTAVVRAGKTVLVGQDPGWPALQVANRVLGGDDGARLAVALDTLAPGVQSVLIRRADVGSFQIRFETTPTAVEEAVRMALAEVETMRRTAPSLAELEDRQAELVGAARASRSDGAQVANQVTQYVLLGRGRAEITGYEERVLALEPEQIRVAAEGSLDPEAMAIVVAGDATQLYDPLLELGPVDVVDLAGETVALEGLQAPPLTHGLDATSLLPRVWTYRVMVQGMRQGDVTRRIRGGPDPGTIRLESDAEIGPRTVSREVTFEASSFMPLESRDNLQVGPQSMYSALTVERGRVTGTLRVPGTERAVESVAAPGAILGEMAEAALWLLDLDSNETFTLPVIGQDGVTSEVTIEVKGTTTVSVPAGSFDTYEIEMAGAGQNQRVFVTRDVPRQTIKIELVDQPVETVLIRVQDGAR